ncbi:MAG: prolipoprotein diacylglyceryl transferase [Myxococcota bacterium]
MHPILFEIGPLPLHVYGLMIAIAFLVGMQLAARDARRVDLSKNRDFDKFVLDLCFGILIVSMIGSRIMFIIVNFDEYAKDPLKIFRIWEGGLVFYGGLIGALLYSVYYSRKHQHDFFLVADTLIPYVALGAMFGRIGCFAAGCCWGQTVDPSFPLAVQFPAGSLIFSSMAHNGLIPPTAAWTLHVHPVQLYDSFGELGIFMLLSFVRTRKRFHGHVFLVFMFLYPIWRSLVETIRGDKERGLYDILGLVKLSTSQIISILIATTAVSILFALRRRMVTTSPVPSAAPSA